MREIKFRAWDGKRMISSEKYSFIGNYDDLYFYDLNNIFKDTSMIFMQYTGLKDKNGKEIYEGDILKNDDIGEKPNLVIYEHGGFSCQAGGYSDYSKDIKDTFIIGNVYENPELLEKSDVR